MQDALDHKDVVDLEWAAKWARARLSIATRKDLSLLKTSCILVFSDLRDNGEREHREINMTLTKATLAERLSAELGLNKSEAKELVAIFLDEIREALESGQPVQLSGFGTFELRDKREGPV